MVEWLALIVSILSLFLQRDKIKELVADFTSWRSQERYKREGEVFVKSIAPRHKKDDFRTVFSMFFFFFLMSSGLSGLLKAASVEEISAIGTLTLSPLLLLSVRGLVKQFKEYKGGWFVAALMTFFFVMTFAGLGLLWGIITVGFISMKLSVFWAGLSATPCVLALLWLMQYIGRRTWAKPYELTDEEIKIGERKK